MQFKNLIYQRGDDGILTIRFNRTDQLNAMTEEMGDELVAAAAEASRDNSLRAVILTGEGKAFSAGGDMNMIRAKSEADALTNQADMGAFYRRFLRIRDIPVPTIASINGAAIGAGLCVALACDIRIASVDATLAVNFTALGLHPGMGGTWLLPRVVGLPMAAELLFSSRRINGAEAERIGLVNHACPLAELSARTRQLAEEIAGCGPVAVRLTKRALATSLGNSLTEQLDIESLQQALTFETKDVKEGISAIVAKRRPEFKGH